MSFSNYSHTRRQARTHTFSKYPIFKNSFKNHTHIFKTSYILKLLLEITLTWENSLKLKYSPLCYLLNQLYRKVHLLIDKGTYVINYGDNSQ